MPTADSREIVETYGPLVYGIALAKMRTREDAEDIFQEVFLTYVRKQPTFSDVPSARAWFARTTVHHCRTLWRTKGRHQTEPLEAAEQVAADAKESTLDLRRALDWLPKKYRQVIMMYYFAGLSTVEIAEALGVSANTVRIRMTRARQMLADHLSADAPEGGSV